VSDCTALQLGYTVPFTLVNIGKHETEDKQYRQYTN